jgi:O-antigen/teichoic acid export membrane protein
MLAQRVKALSELLKEHLSRGTLRALLVRGVSGTFLLTGINLSFNLAISLTLARILGADGFGAYSYAVAVIGLLTVPALCGFENVVIRNVSVLDTSGNLGLMKGLLKRASQIVTGTAVLLCLLVLACEWMFGGHHSSDLSRCLQIGVVLLPVLVITRLIQSAMQGLNKVVPGQMPERLFHPVLFLAAVVTTWSMAPGNFSPETAIILHIGCAMFALAAGAVILARSLPSGFREAPESYETWEWLKSALPLLAVMATHVLIHQTDIIMLGMLSTARNVGIYRAVTKGAELISFALFIISPALGPIIARLHHEGDMVRLQKTVAVGATACAAMALPVSLVMIFFGKYLLLLFGAEFVDGTSALSILSVAHFFNAFAGVAGIALVMSGRERDAALGFTTGAVVNVVLNAVLIPRFGMEGAALATGASLVLLNSILVLRARLSLSIRSTALRFV